MPKPGRSRHEIELVRDRILDCALDIIATKGSTDVPCTASAAASA